MWAAIAILVLGKEVFEEMVAELAECQECLENLMRALEGETEAVLFAVENPAGSELWEMMGILQRTEKPNGTVIWEPGWRLKQQPTWALQIVDQCAYNKRNKKPTAILHIMGEYHYCHNSSSRGWSLHIIM